MGNSPTKKIHPISEETETVEQKKGKMRAKVRSKIGSIKNEIYNMLKNDLNLNIKYTDFQIKFVKQQHYDEKNIEDLIQLLKDSIDPKKKEYDQIVSCKIYPVQEKSQLSAEYEVNEYYRSAIQNYLEKKTLRNMYHEYDKDKINKFLDQWRLFKNLPTMRESLIKDILTYFSTIYIYEIKNNGEKEKKYDLTNIENILSDFHKLKLLVDNDILKNPFMKYNEYKDETNFYNLLKNLKKCDNKIYEIKNTLKKILEEVEKSNNHDDLKKLEKYIGDGRKKSSNKKRKSKSLNKKRKSKSLNKKRKSKSSNKKE